MLNLSSVSKCVLLSCTATIIVFSVVLFSQGCTSDADSVNDDYFERVIVDGLALPMGYYTLVDNERFERVLNLTKVQLEHNLMRLLPMIEGDKFTDDQRSDLITLIRNIEKFSDKHELYVYENNKHVFMKFLKAYESLEASLPETKADGDAR